MVDGSLRLAVTRLRLAPEAAADADLRLLAIMHRVTTAGGTLTVKTEDRRITQPDGPQSRGRKPA